jgi:hypothetical protein
VLLSCAHSTECNQRKGNRLLEELKGWKLRTLPRVSVVRGRGGLFSICQQVVWVTFLLKRQQRQLA